MSWIKGLFSKKPGGAERVASMERRQMSLSMRSEKLYEEIGVLEDKEKNLVEDGKASASKITKRRLAQQISLLRKDIRMRNTSAVMLNRQINTLGVHLRNLELVQSNSAAGLPSCDELTEAAVNAEGIIESLTDNDDLVNSIENQMDHSMSAEEAAILAEFEEDGEEEPDGQEEPDEEGPKYEGLCSHCNGGINVGEPTWWKKGDGAAHRSCQKEAEKADQRLAVRFGEQPMAKDQSCS